MFVSPEVIDADDVKVMHTSVMSCYKIACVLSCEERTYNYALKVVLSVYYFCTTVAEMVKAR